jgi:hypothetical protein
MNNSRARVSSRWRRGALEESIRDAEITTAATARRATAKSRSVACRFMFATLSKISFAAVNSLECAGPAALWSAAAWRALVRQK